MLLINVPNVGYLSKYFENEKINCYFFNNIFSCTIKCFQTHKQNNCEEYIEIKETTIQPKKTDYNFKTEDTVSIDKLEKLGYIFDFINFLTIFYYLLVFSYRK